MGWVLSLWRSGAVSAALSENRGTWSGEGRVGGPVVNFDLLVHQLTLSGRRRDRYVSDYLDLDWMDPPRTLSSRTQSPGVSFNDINGPDQIAGLFLPRKSKLIQSTWWKHCFINESMLSLAVIFSLKSGHQAGRPSALICRFWRSHVFHCESSRPFGF